MTAKRRLSMEISNLNTGLPHFRDIRFETDDDMLRWTGLLVPEKAPYNQGAFRIEFTFPEEYPYAPPYVRFLTKIYHPNVDEVGRVCLSIISEYEWCPLMQTKDIVDDLISLIHYPEPSHALRPDLAKEYMKDREKFIKNAEEYTRKYSENRPDDPVLQ